MDDIKNCKHGWFYVFGNDCGESGEWTSDDGEQTSDDGEQTSDDGEQTN